MAFIDKQKNPTQEHFTVVEIDLPIITGTCQLQNGAEGYGTPLSCPVQDGTSSVEFKTYRFATENAPLINASPVYRCIEVCNEEATRLKSGEGLAIRGGGNVSFKDFKGDPNLERQTGIDAKLNGTFFGKFQARNSFSGFELRVRKYRKGDNVDFSLVGYDTQSIETSLGTNLRCGVYSSVDDLTYILAFDGSGVIFNQEDNSVIGTFTNPSITNLSNSVYYQNNNTAYVVTLGVTDKVHVFDCATQTFTAEITFTDAGSGSSNRPIALYNGFIYAGLYDGSLIKIDPSTNTIDSTIIVDAGNDINSLSVGNGFLYIATSDGIQKIDGADNLTVITTGDVFTGITDNFDSVYAINNAGTNIVNIDYDDSIISTTVISSISSGSISNFNNSSDLVIHATGGAARFYDTSTRTIVNESDFIAASNTIINTDENSYLIQSNTDNLIEITGSLVDDALITYYKTKEIQFVGQDKWRLSFNDELARINFDKTEYPPNSGELVADIDNAVTSFQVSGNIALWSIATPYVIKIGDELLTVTNVVDNGSDIATLTVNTRGSNIGTPDFAAFISATVADQHSAGDEVLICKTFNNAKIETVAQDILNEAGISNDYIPLNAWSEEAETWLSGKRLTKCFYDREPSNEALYRLLNGFMIDMWYEPIDRQVKFSTVNAWRQAVKTLTEGVEIDYQTFRHKQNENNRYSRAVMAYDKRNLTDPDENESFKKSSIAIRSDLEVPELYPEKKLYRFQNNHLVDKEDADLTVARYAQRYGTPPEDSTWITQERNLSFKTGDVVALDTESLRGFDGLPSADIRAQIIQIQLVNATEGRYYRVSALTYQPAGLADLVIPEGEDINLWVLFGAPSDAGCYTVVFDGGIFCGSSIFTPSVVAGGFASCSKLNIILRNGADWQSKGGTGGAGGVSGPSGSDGSNGLFGGTCYDAQGVDTDIYLSGSDPLGGIANGTLRAAGGGGGGASSVDVGAGTKLGGAGGGGGAGCRVGPGGNSATIGSEGEDGDIEGNGGAGGIVTTIAGGKGGDWGQPGEDGDSQAFSGGAGGAAGKGIVKNGATINLFGESPLNFINGTGDMPDNIQPFTTQDGFCFETQDGFCFYVNK